MNQKPSVAKNVVWNWIRVLVGIIFPLVSFPYISRVLGPDGIGKVGYIYSIVGYFSLVAILGVPNYGIKEGAKLRDDKEKLGKFTTEMVIINIAASVLSTAAYLCLLAFPTFQNYKALIIIMVGYIPLSSLGLAWVFQVFEDYRRITIQTICIQAISLALLFLLVRDSGDYLQYAFVHVFSSMGSNVLYLVSASRRVKLFGYKNYNIKKHLKPILILFGMGAASTLYLNFDSTMLGSIVGDTSVGLYSAANKVTVIVSTLLSSICGVILARMAYYVGIDQQEKFHNLLRNTIICMLMLSIPASIGLILLSEPIVLILCGEQYLDAVPAMCILSANLIIAPINGLIAYQVLLPYNREKYSAIATVAGAVLNLSLNYFVIPQFMQTGAAATTLVSEWCVFAICVFAARDLLRNLNIAKSIFQIIAGCVPILAVGVLINNIIQSSWLRVLLITPIGGISYFLVLMPMKNDMLLYLIEPIKHRLFKKIRR